MLRRYTAGLSSKCHDQTKKIKYYSNDKYHADAGNVMASLTMFLRKSLPAVNPLNCDHKLFLHGISLRMGNFD